jgi:hypothetical protein
MLCNFAISPPRRESRKLLNLCLVSSPCGVGDFHQIFFKRPRKAMIYKDVRSFKAIDRNELLETAASFWIGTRFGLWLE